MEPRPEAALVLLSTAPSLEQARELAAALLDARLAACVQILPGLESHYVWQGRREQSAEVLITIKTSEQRRRDVEALFAERHPYSVPELVALAPTFVEAKYLAWLRQAVATEPPA
jgi:periplasmic divalent cation tolerance protein